MMGLLASASGIGQHSKGWTSDPPAPRRGLSEMKKILTRVKGVPSEDGLMHPALMDALLGLHPGSSRRPSQAGSKAKPDDPEGRS